MLSDSQLLEAYAKNGSQAAFAELLHKYLPLVYRSALRQLNNDQHRAKDVSQVVFVSLARQAFALGKHTSLAGWLYTTTRYTACQIMRAEVRRQQREQESWIMLESEENKPTEASWSIISSALDKTLQSLSAKDREAILLRFYANQSFAEVGKMLQLNEDAARMRVARVLDKIRAALARQGHAASAPGLAALFASDAASGAPLGLEQTITSCTLHVTPLATCTAATWISLMATSKLVSSLTVVAAIAATGFATHEARRADLEKTTTVVTESQLMDLRKRVSETKQRIQERPLTDSSSPTSIQKKPTNGWDAERSRGDRFLAAHPEVRDTLTRSMQARVKGKYLPLYHELRLNNGQIEEFERLLIGSSGTFRPSVGILEVGEHLLPEERKQRLVALLGDSGYLRFKAGTEAVQTGRMEGGGDYYTQRMAANLVFTDQPMSPAQSSAIVAIIEKARAQIPENGDIWSSVLPEIQKVLTSEQVEGIALTYLDDRYEREKFLRSNDSVVGSSK